MKANQTDLYLFVIPAPVSTQPDRPWLWHRGNVFFFFLRCKNKWASHDSEHLLQRHDVSADERWIKSRLTQKEIREISWRDERVVVVVPAECAGIDGWMGGEGVSRMAGWIREGGVCVKWKVKSARLRDVGGGRGTLDYSILLSSPLQKYQLLSLNICPLSDAAPQRFFFSKDEGQEFTNKPRLGDPYFPKRWWLTRERSQGWGMFKTSRHVWKVCHVYLQSWNKHSDVQWHVKGLLKSSSAPPAGTQW